MTYVGWAVRPGGAGLARGENQAAKWAGVDAVSP